MGQRLVVVRDRGAIDRNAESLDGCQLGELPEAAEQPAGRPPPEHELAAFLDPHERAREQRQVARLLARRDHR